jgi:hypothetical protein
MGKPAKKVIQLEVLTNITLKELVKKSNRDLLEESFRTVFCVEGEIFEIHQVTAETVKPDY